MTPTSPSPPRSARKAPPPSPRATAVGRITRRRAYAQGRRRHRARDRRGAQARPSMRRKCPASSRWRPPTRACSTRARSACARSTRPGHDARHRLPHRLDDQGDHLGRGDAARRAGQAQARRARCPTSTRRSARPRCWRASTLRRAEAAPGEAADHPAPPADAHRRASATSSGTRTSVRYVKASGMPLDAPPARSRRSACRWCSIRATSGSTASTSTGSGRLVESISGQPLDVYFRDKIFAPLGMKDSGYVTSAEQRARQARVHTRQPDGSARAPAAGDAPFTPGVLVGRRPAVLDGARLPHVPADAAARRQPSTARGCSKPETVALMGTEPHRRHPVRHHEDESPARSNDVDLFPGAPDPLGPRLHAEHGARAERPQRRHGELGRASSTPTTGSIRRKRVTGLIMTQILPFADTTRP